MRIGQQTILERLAREEPCLGAVFCSYTFDPAFFEDQVLRALLRWSSDPVEQSARFYDEACRALQTTPVACFVDSGVYPGGRRLPYDLTLCSGRIFHPKLALVLYESHARLYIGSANLTPSGFGNNAELFVVEELSYESSGDAQTLHEAVAFLRRVADTWPPAGKQFQLVVDELSRLRSRGKDGGRAAAAPESFEFLHTENGRPILTQLLALVPADAEVTRVGLLAPFYENDDPGVESIDEVKSVLATLATLSKRSRIVLDVGVEWQDSPVHPAPGSREALDRGIGHVWATRTATTQETRVDYWTLDAVHQTSLDARDALGERRRWVREEVEEERRLGSTWDVGRPLISAPEALLGTVADAGTDLRLWLYPTRRLEDERPVRRPLHAKLLVLTYRRRGRDNTVVFVGSANASRKGLLGSSADGGNVECGFVFTVNVALTLGEMSPELVFVDRSAVEFSDRKYEPLFVNVAQFVDSAVYDAAAQRLEVNWRRQPGAPLFSWRLGYDSKEIARGSAIPLCGVTIIDSFMLSPHSLELTLTTDGGAAAIPIIVRELRDLPIGLAAYQPSLRELLALLGRRVGEEKIKSIHEPGEAMSVQRFLDLTLGEGFGAHDVFAAWWGIADDLSDEQQSLTGFRFKLDGALGARGLWRRLVEAARSGSDEVTTTEAWFYGAELARTLAAVPVAAGGGGQGKWEVLDRFLHDLRTDLIELQPSSNASWLRTIAAFYDLPVEASRGRSQRGA